MNGFGELSGCFVWSGGVDGGEFIVESTGDVFVFVVGFVVEEGY